MNSKKGFSTTAIHGKKTKDTFRSHVTPIYNTSTYLFESAEQAEAIFTGKESAYVYGRFGSPTITEVEEKITSLETFNLNIEAKSILHSSGMSAITTLLLSNLSHGQKILTHYSLYGGTQEFLDKILNLCGVESIIVNFNNLNSVETSFKNNPEINLVYIETPANPTLQCIDLEQICTIAKKYNKKIAVDNTFATPYLQQPFKYGVDFIVHSTTKFLNGHGNAIGGILIGTDLQFMNTKATKHHRLLGGNSNGMDAFLLSNGIKTLELRMKQHCENANKVADFLNQHSKIEFVNHLSLSTHPHYNIAKKQMREAGALMSFELKEGIEAGRKFLNNLQLCTHAVSLGTIDTLISHPASTTHIGVPRDLRLKSGITDGLIRLSVGIENIDDILNDLEQTLNKI